MIDAALDRLFSAIDGRELERAIAGELGSLDALDGFVIRAGRADGYAAPIGRVAIVSSDTTIGVSLAPATFALCAKCDVAIRDRSDELCAAFRESLCEERSEFVDALAVYPPAAHDDPTWLGELAQSDAVVAFGSDAALAAIRSATPAQARFIPFGHRTSLAYVAREALASEAAAVEAAARLAPDALLYDGEGCLSVHAAFVEKGGVVSPARFAELAAAAVERAAVEFPATYGAAPAQAIAYRDATAFRAALGQGAVYARAGAAEIVVFDPPRDEPPPLLPRTLALYPVDGPEAMLTFVRDQRLPLEAIGVAAPASRRDLEAAAVAAGAVRIAPLGTLQAPSLVAEHGGAGRITPFVRWIVRET